MNIFSLFYTNVLYLPILNALIAIYHVFVFLHLANALGWAIILLTVVVRIIVYPLTGAQLRTSQKMQKLTPHLNKLKERHKDDAKTLQVETMKLYKEHGVNPAAGCLPSLIQLPVIWGLYGVLQHVVNTNPEKLLQEINKIVYLPGLKLSAPINTHFFGLPLGISPSKLLGTVGVLILLFPVVTAFLQFLQSKMMFQVFEEKIHEVETDAKKTKNKALMKEVKKEDDFSSAMQTQSMYILPLMIGFFSWSLPLGLSLYWNTFTIFGIIQQYEIARNWGGLEPWINRLRGKRNG